MLIRPVRRLKWVEPRTFLSFLLFFFCVDSTSFEISLPILSPEWNEYWRCGVSFVTSRVGVDNFRNQIREHSPNLLFSKRGGLCFRDGSRLVPRILAGQIRMKWGRWTWGSSSFSPQVGRGKKITSLAVVGASRGFFFVVLFDFLLFVIIPRPESLVNHPKGCWFNWRVVRCGFHHGTRYPPVRSNKKKITW